MTTDSQEPQYADFKAQYASDVVFFEHRAGNYNYAEHHVKMPRPGEKFLRQKLRSASRFNEREKERAYGEAGSKSGDWLAYAMSLPKYFIMEEKAYREWKNADHQHNGLADFVKTADNQFVHESLSDFYTAIGYDIKKKRFL